jgi:carbohydrate-binding DOMON domain-containing protein
MRDRTTMLAAGFLAGALAAAPAWAEKVTFNDPTGDDNGPGNYVYPTDAVYSPGSFDLVALEVEDKGKNVDFSVEVNSKLDDPWGMGVGFAVQMIFIFIDTDGVTGSGYTDGLPGLNISFDPAHAWDKVVVLSPQQQSRVNAEARVKLPEKLAAGDVLVPRRTLGKGKSISGRISKEDIGSGDATKWGYQVVVQSNEGFPAKTDFLTRKVNEFEGQHRFGGGTDSDCDPHVMDILAPPASGSDAERQGQYDQLAYECDIEGNASEMATLITVRK